MTDAAKRKMCLKRIDSHIIYEHGSIHSKRGLKVFLVVNQQKFLITDAPSKKEAKWHANQFAVALERLVSSEVERYINEAQDD